MYIRIVIGTVAPADLVLQLVLKRIIQGIKTAFHPVQSLPIASLSVREQNVIRYVAGYVVMKRKKFQVKSRCSSATDDYSIPENAFSKVLSNLPGELLIVKSSRGHYNLP